MAPARILVVEDDDTIRQLAVTVLALEGYDVLAARDAEVGRTMVAELQPDVVLMDRQLPGMDGLTLTRILKADPRTWRITVLAFSGDDAREHDRNAVAAGCDGFLAKPVDVAALLRTVAWHVAVRRSRFGPRTLVHTKHDAAPFQRPLGAAQRSAAHVLPALTRVERPLNPVSETL
jgi:CheY-like chemotaxis protein